MGFNTPRMRETKVLMTTPRNSTRRLQFSTPAAAIAKPSRWTQKRKSNFGQKKMASAAPGFRPDPFQMNSNASEPARPSLVGHPPIIASSIALTNE